MPSLTDQEYMDRRKVVFREWFIHHGDLFARLPLREEHALHTYFATEEDFQRPQLLAYRARITREQPALAQEAGRAFHDLELLRAGGDQQTDAALRGVSHPACSCWAVGTEAANTRRLSGGTVDTGGEATGEGADGVRADFSR